MTAQRLPTRRPARRRRRRLRLVLVGGFGIGVAIAACIPAGSASSGDPAAAGSPPPAAAGASRAPSGPTPRPSFVPPTPTPQPTFFVYTVVPGDNLNSIAHHFGTTSRSIAFWNRATYPSLDPESSGYKPGLLQVGWTLMVIPNAVFDEQELPEPSDLIGPQPTPTPSDDGDATASGDLGPIDPNAP